jgi:hypothetical protein
MDPPTTIRHVHHADYFSLSSEGVADLDSFRRSVDALLKSMGDPSHHDILFDLRGAGEIVLPEAVLAQALGVSSNGPENRNRLAAARLGPGGSSRTLQGFSRLSTSRL